MKTISLLEDKIVVEGGEGRPLGRVCLYTVPEDIALTRDELRTKFWASGIEESLLPQPIRAVDAFRRACEEGKRAGVPGQNGTTLNYLVREVSSDADVVLRHIVEETRNERGKRLDYRTVVHLEFWRRYETLAWRTPGGNGLPDHIMEIVNKIRAAYDRNRKFYDADHFRRLFAQMLRDRMSPTLLRPATYFVPERYAGELAKLKTLAEAVGAWFVVMPLYDQEGAREMVHSQFEEQVQAHIVRLAEVLKKDKLTAGEANALLAETKRVLGQVAEYEEILRTSLAHLEANVEVARAQLVAVLDKVAA